LIFVTFLIAFYLFFDPILRKELEQVVEQKKRNRIQEPGQINLPRYFTQVLIELHLLEASIELS